MNLTRRQRLLVCGSVLSAKTTPALPGEWKKIAASTDGVVGATARHPGSGNCSATSETVQGLTTATNDSGVIYLPNGALLAVSVYVKNPYAGFGGAGFGHRRDFPRRV